MEAYINAVTVSEVGVTFSTSVDADWFCVFWFT